MEQKEVVIRRRLLGTVLFVVICAVFVAGGVFGLYFGDDDMRVVAIVGIIFFGICGLHFLFFGARKPIAVVSDKGITVPDSGQFVPWENIRKIEVLEQVILAGKGSTTTRYIGVFVRDSQGIIGAAKRPKSISKIVTGWSEMPEVLIDPSFSFVKIDKIKEILDEFYDKHKSGNPE